MVFSCCAIGCTNRQGKNLGVAFYRFPVDADRRNKWVTAVNRKGWTPTPYSRLCSQHFITGAKSNNPLSPDYIPSLFTYTKSAQKKRALRDLERFKRNEERKQRLRLEKEKEAAAETLMFLASQSLQSSITEVIPCQSEASFDWNHAVSCQTEMDGSYILFLEEECKRLRDENFILKEKLKASDAKMQTSNNLSSYILLTNIL